MSVLCDTKLRHRVFCAGPWSRRSRTCVGSWARRRRWCSWLNASGGRYSGSGGSCSELRGSGYPWACAGHGVGQQAGCCAQVSLQACKASCPHPRHQLLRTGVAISSLTGRAQGLKGQKGSGMPAESKPSVVDCIKNTKNRDRGPLSPFSPASCGRALCWLPCVCGFARFATER